MKPPRALDIRQATVEAWNVPRDNEFDKRLSLQAHAVDVTIVASDDEVIRLQFSTNVGRYGFHNRWDEAIR